MNVIRGICVISSLQLLVACSEPPPPVSVSAFMENPRLLEATMVRCSQNRAETRYDAECVNAREAINRLEAVQEKARRAELEKQSERKRQALRRTQEAAAAARQRALEEQRRREEAAYQGLFDAGTAANPAPAASPGAAPGTSVQPVVDVPATEPMPLPEAPADSGIQEAADAGADSDLAAIREELKRRQQTPE